MSTENTETKTPTPRTDALILAHLEMSLPHLARLNRTIDHARQLETELAAAQAQIAGLRALPPKWRERWGPCWIPTEELQQALSAPPPPVVSREEHERVVEERDDWQDTFAALIEKIGYTEEVAAEAEKQTGSKLVSDGISWWVAKKAEAAEQDAERLAGPLKEFHDGYQCGFYHEGRPCGCESCQLSAKSKEALAAHEARKGGK